MIKNGKGGGNTKTGLIFEGKTDLGTFLSQQKGYSVDTVNEQIIFNGKSLTVKIRTVYYHGIKIAELYKKNEFYSSFLKN